VGGSGINICNACSLMFVSLVSIASEHHYRSILVPAGSFISFIFRRSLFCLDELWEDPKDGTKGCERRDIQPLERATSSTEFYGWIDILSYICGSGGQAIWSKNNITAANGASSVSRVSTASDRTAFGY